MIQMLFFLRFRSQLRRIRAEEVSLLEESVIRAAEAAGGKVKQEHRLLSAVFNEDALGFWLDMAALIETVQKALDRAGGELFGYACVFDRDIAGEEMEKLCRRLSVQTGSADAGGRGIWCGPPVYRALAPYAGFETEELPPSPPEDPPVYLRLKNIKPFSGTPPAARFPFREKIQQTISQGDSKNTLLCGPAFMGKRDGLYHFCAARSGETPPLSIRFGFGGQGPVCLTDALDSRIRDFIRTGAPENIQKRLEKLDALGERIFRERLGDEISPVTEDMIRRFFHNLLGLYREAAESRNLVPVLVLENIHRADSQAARIFMDIFTGLPNRKNIAIYGTCEAQKDRSPAKDEQLRDWGRIFSRIVQFDAADLPARNLTEIPPDIWEFAYAFFILGQYFPGDLLQRLFEEEGKTPAVMSLALRILVSLGLADSLQDPRPRIPGFAARAGETLGDRKEKIHALVRNRLLAWVFSEKIRPCFRLLLALNSLGGRAGDELILKALREDLVLGTFGGIENALRENYFTAITGQEKSAVLIYIYRTLRALLHGDEREIREAFQDPPPEDCPAFPKYQTRILMNLTAFRIGVHDTSAATETVKQAMILSQRQNEDSAQGYRLFSLIELSKGRIDDALEYTAFAMDNAEKAGETGELAVSAYYAAAAQFLFGNLSRAERFARRAVEAALASGRIEWADRSRFLQGKLRFEAGYYQDALEIFEAMERDSAGAPETAREQVLSAWIYRARVFLRNPPARPPLLTGDCRFFEIEASYLAEDYRKTAALAETLRNAPPDEDFLYTEQPDWRSGFAQCELLILSPGELRDHFCTAYKALSLSRLACPRDSQTEALERLRRLLRDKMAPGRDPNDLFYFYAYYRILHESGAAAVDINTSVSLAFKRLQRRASRIEDMETRRAFLSLPYWNGVLSAAAREHKLI